MSYPVRSFHSTLSRSLETTGSRRALERVAQVVAGSLFVAICAHIAVPVPFSPVPFTLQPFAVLLVAFLLGPAMSASTMVAYLVEGAAGMPVFTPGLGGVPQILGPTGGFLMAYPLVACVSAYVYGLFKPSRKFIGGVAGGLAGIAILFTAGVCWFSTVLHVSLSQAFGAAALPYIPSDVVKVCAAAGIASALHRARR